MIKLSNLGSKSYSKLHERRSHESKQFVDVIVGRENSSRNVRSFLGSCDNFTFGGQKVGDMVYVGFGTVMIYGRTSDFKLVK